MCRDLSKLNRFVWRERYPSLNAAEVVTDIHQSQTKFFTVFDALKSYHQCPLDEETKVDNFYHSLWPIQISERTVWNIVH